MGVESTQGASMKIFCLECGRKSKKSKKKKMKEKNHTEEFSSGNMPNMMVTRATTVDDKGKTMNKIKLLKRQETKEFDETTEVDTKKWDPNAKPRCSNLSINRKSKSRNSQMSSSSFAI